MVILSVMYFFSCHSCWIGSLYNCCPHFSQRPQVTFRLGKRSLRKELYNDQPTRSFCPLLSFVSIPFLLYGPSHFRLQDSVSVYYTNRHTGPLRTPYRTLDVNFVIHLYSISLQHLQFRFSTYINRLLFTSLQWIWVLKYVHINTCDDSINYV